LVCKEKKHKVEGFFIAKIQYVAIIDLQYLKKILWICTLYLEFSMNMDKLLIEDILLIFFSEQVKDHDY